MKQKLVSLMLTLMVLSVASVNAQVRIGGIDDPHTSAILDLNATDAANDGALGLALPRVTLSATDLVPNGMTAPATGLTVFNTATAGTGETAVTPGAYYWANSQWNRVATGGDATAGSSAVMDATEDGGLVRAGSGTTDDPYTLGIKDSPDFTGTPTAPTAAANTNNTQIATTEFVQTAVQASSTPVLPGGIAGAGCTWYRWDMISEVFDKSWVVIDASLSNASYSTKVFFIRFSNPDKPVVTYYANSTLYNQEVPGAQLFTCLASF
ncbi:MAG: hypothetical protein LBO74_03610 [Candidatus Symbiothrix sp.]|jgi:hypothetical protein|nr:hypothetical protein [Candidatus Symbiothrix sp.]